MANANALETYANQYFTGAQASIWIGDVWIDECYGIQFSASQSILPIFGYASTYFDAVARGKVLVQGAFEINFVDEGYLFAVLDREYSRNQIEGIKVSDADASVSAQAPRTQTDVI
jgi:hypothetical protein